MLSFKIALKINEIINKSMMIQEINTYTEIRNKSTDE